MRKTFLLLAVFSFIACAKKETATTDSAAVAAATPPAMAMVTPADLAGTFNVTVMAATSDSVLAHVTCTQAAGSTDSKCVNAAAPKDTINYTYAISGDSVMWTSTAYAPPAPPKSPKVIDHVVGHMSGGKWSGTTVSVLAAKPDSVVNRSRWEATKTP